VDRGRVDAPPHGPRPRARRDGGATRHATGGQGRRGTAAQDRRRPGRDRGRERTPLRGRHASRGRAGESRRGRASGDRDAEGFVSFLGLPLFLENQLVGILTVWYREPHSFAPDEVALGEALATSATAAIRNARLYEETQERLRHTETLLAVSYDTSSTLELT